MIKKSLGGLGVGSFMMGVVGCQSITVYAPPVSSSPPALSASPAVSTINQTPPQATSAAPIVPEIPVEIPTPLAMRALAGTLWLNAHPNLRWNHYLRKFPLSQEEMEMALPAMQKYLENIGRSSEESQFVTATMGLDFICRELAENTDEMWDKLCEIRKSILDKKTQEECKAFLASAEDVKNTLNDSFNKGRWPKRIFNFWTKEHTKTENTEVSLSNGLSQP